MRFPPGKIMMGEGYSGLNGPFGEVDGSLVSTMPFILPFIEQGNLNNFITCDQNLRQSGSPFFWDISGGSAAPLDWEASQFSVGTFICPSAPTEQVSIIGISHNFGYALGTSNPFMNAMRRTDYVSNAGVVGATNASFVSGPLQGVPLRTMRGPYTNRSRETFGSMSDGSSNVVAFAEASPAFEIAFSETAVFGHAWFSAGNMISLWGINDRHGNGTDDAPLQNRPRLSWYSYHTGGINLSYCDGSVAFISEDVDETAYFQSTGIADGFVADIRQ
jgi:prepilin-type processing-associated H-X9-DG protein